MNVDIKELARELARELRRSDYLVGPSDIAAMAGYSANSSAMRRMLADPSFPKCVELVEGGHRRYRRKDVEAWMDKHFDDIDRAIIAAVSA